MSNAAATDDPSRWLDPVAVDCAFQLQLRWARINWGVTLLPAGIGAVRVHAPLEGEAIRVELRIRPGSRPPLCHADHVFLSRDGEPLATLSDVVGTGSKKLNRLGGSDGADRLEPAAGEGAARR